MDQVSAADRREIEDADAAGRAGDRRPSPRSPTRPRDVPAEPIAPGRYRLRIGGRLSLHGVTRPHPIDAELLVFDDGVRLRGECPLRLSDYRISR